MEQPGPEDRGLGGGCHDSGGTLGPDCTAGQNNTQQGTESRYFGGRVSLTWHFLPGQCVCSPAQPNAPPPLDELLEKF